MLQKENRAAPFKKGRLVTEKKWIKILKIRPKFLSSKCEVGHCHNWFCIRVVGDL